MNHLDAAAYTQQNQNEAIWKPHNKKYTTIAEILIEINTNSESATTHRQHKHTHKKYTTIAETLIEINTNSENARRNVENARNTHKSQKRMPITCVQ